MRSIAAAFRSLVLPFGATTGTRIVIDGVNGDITIFDFNDAVRLQFGVGNPSSILFSTGDTDEVVPGSVTAAGLSSGGFLFHVLRMASPADDTGTADEQAEVELRSRSEDGTQPPMVALRGRNLADELRLGVVDDSAGTRNQPMGTAVLVAGTVTVTHTTVSANSRIVIWRQVAGGTLGNLSVGAITAGTSFVINSDNAADTSTVGYLIIEAL